jgi:hypothetical protein
MDFPCDVAGPGEVLSNFTIDDDAAIALQTLQVRRQMRRAQECASTDARQKPIRAARHSNAAKTIVTPPRLE